jgi:hypothetical protein
LKPLNGTTRNACVPVRLYNIDLQIRANHSTNHSITFPMSGPIECLKKLPYLDEKYCPQVTFLGPPDEWMKKTGKYRYLYEMDISKNTIILLPTPPLPPLPRWRRRMPLPATPLAAAATAVGVTPCYF